MMQIGKLGSLVLIVFGEEVLHEISRQIVGGNIQIGIEQNFKSTHTHIVAFTKEVI